METELRARAEATVRIVLDVLAGARPAHQLSQVAVPAVYQELERLYPPPAGRTAPPGARREGRAAPPRGASPERTNPPGTMQPGRAAAPTGAVPPGATAPTPAVPPGAAGPRRAVPPGAASPGRTNTTGAGLPRRALPAGRVVPARVLSSWLQRPATGVAEVGAVVVVAGRVRALALRLELHRGRWRCTAVETTGP
ncbi:Rv3235 family protein [Actinomadura litoris]|uniref:Rv3235 family protein n=1 Tax=Actinomadura litoris TaxID=2678616 RepID=UPI001FA7EEA3|nr:Rv3235 family protein [Actinomadura litoris]